MMDRFVACTFCLVDQKRRISLDVITKQLKKRIRSVYIYIYIYIKHFCALSFSKCVFLTVLDVKFNFHHFCWTSYMDFVFSSCGPVACDDMMWDGKVSINKLLESSVHDDGHWYLKYPNPSNCKKLTLLKKQRD